nr:protein FAR-RED impaired response 1-like [Tanacetum cinerariifolium]
MVFLNKYWLTQYNERFVAAWTDKFPHFGNQTTNRVESQHAKLKLYLDSAQSELLTAVSYIHEVVNSQETAIHSSLEHSKIVTRHRYNIPLFINLNKHISLHVLDILFEEYTRCVDGLGLEICECQLRRRYGLPCSDEQLVYMNKSYPIPLEAIDRFWRKLNLSPCASLGDDDLGCQVKVEVENFNTEFKKQSIAGKKSLLRKMKEITTPSETSLNEPATQKATGGRSSFKRALADQPSQTQEPAGYNFSSMPTFVGKDNFMNQKQRRHAYIDQFPNMLHPYIEEVDVRADGNCEFRAVAVGLKLHENEWPVIRYDLMEELRIYYYHYVVMFGAKECDDVKKRLNFFKNELAPIEKWMNMPEIGFLIASRYNVIFHNITTLGSMTYLSLRSISPPWYDHKFITLGYVNSSHYVNVLLQGDYPVPTIASQWCR